MTKPKIKKGFSCMDPERVREICSAGGKAAHAKGTAHEFTSEKARIAGKKGGLRTAELRALGQLPPGGRKPKPSASHSFDELQEAMAPR